MPSTGRMPLPWVWWLAVLGAAEESFQPGVEEWQQASLLPADDECRGTVPGECALSALQHQGRRLGGDFGTKEQGRALDNCHTAVQGESCWDDIQWAKRQGIQEHPEWYPGLDASSSEVQFQQAVHVDAPEKCPRPCIGTQHTSALPAPVSIPTEGERIPLPAQSAMDEAGIAAQKGKWCATGPIPTLWTANQSGPAVQVKILSYNLFWWNLYDRRGGNGDSAGKLIARSNEPQPFDFMGFQECEDPERVLSGQGLLKDFVAFQGAHAICMAYAKARWELLAHGQEDVAEDMPTKWYGKRGAQWMRLQHMETGKTAFFVNHHGPLSVNSGGVCGGHATSHNLLRLMGKEAVAGDLLILVGDFNANAASTTIQGLWQNLVHVFNGDSWGGVDNVFSNTGAGDIVSTKILGSGGSDHDAISAVLEIGGGSSQRSRTVAAGWAASAADDLATYPPGYRWEKFWCGKLEQDVRYVFPESAWSASGDKGNPEACCRSCQSEPKCKAWVWIKWASTGPLCQLHGSPPADKKATEAAAGIVSGLSVGEATALARAAATSAVH
eukprot:CAMPEP_0175215298 /NCGR_PEP_ID=MMETSP0093-20121207/17145_1 /TAXON_ID=311494 /ORGANISM="Alexandrium monilatum, Strain CCMP3105" /LENGTH=554 /DNA_ID=CAMNT_0016508667 /DNA_START=50 /DNA_END=1714 /DNA_ORIENTATION=-